MEELKKHEHSEHQEIKKDKTIVDKTIDFVFSSDERKWLLLIFILGVVLRFLVANNISLLGDEAVHGPHTIGFLSSGLISTFAHSPLWLALTDFCFKFLEITIFSVRFLSFFYGSLSILLVFLITKKIFNKKAALLSAFLLSVSFFTIRYTLIEMDLSALFFLLFAAYSFILSMEDKKFPWLAAVCIGLAALIKTLSLFFVPAFIIAFFLFTKKEDNKTKKQHITKIVINVVLFGLIILAIFSPIIMHNYYWCQDQGMVDVYFAKYFKDFKNTTGFPQCLDLDKAQAAYGMQQGYETTFEHSRFLEGTITMSKATFDLDPILVILGLLGIFLTYSLKDKRKYWWFLILFNIFGFVFLILSDWLATHFTTMIPVFCIFGGIFLEKASNDISKKFSIESKTILAIAIILIMLFQLFLLWPHLTSTCAMTQMRGYAIDHMDKNSIVITDARIYTGRVALLFSDFHYLDASLFSSLMEANQDSTNQVQVKLYYLECASDDCGWGTMGNNPGLNESMEQFTSNFAQTPVMKTIFGGGGYDEATGKPYFRVYQTIINLNPELIPLVDSTHNWWYYPVNYKPKSQIFDNYAVKPGFDSLTYQLMKLIIWASIVAAIILAFAPIYYLIKERN